MSGHSFQKIEGMRFAMGSLVAFIWQPEGFWIFKNDSTQPFVPRSECLMNRFENNNYPDRESIEDELKADTRFDEGNRISTRAYKVKTWPVYERPVPPAFGVLLTTENQDPKDKEGQFSGTNITGTLKHRKPKGLAIDENAYPEEAKTNWFLHQPEHLIYLPREDETVENRLNRLIQHYILEYSNELRTHAPFLAPLRGEYSPAQWIVEFCNKAQAVNHESSLYPETYITTLERVEKTRQFPCSNGFNGWIAENLYFQSSIPTNPQDPIEDIAKVIARTVVNAWIDSPPHYANLTFWDTLEYKDLAMLDIGLKGNYYSQVFMGAPWWLQCGFCRWEGVESWQVLSWKVYENNRYKPPSEGRIYFKGVLLYENFDLLGAAMYQSGDQYYLLVFVLISINIIALETLFNPHALRTLISSDFTEVCRSTIQNGAWYKKQSFFINKDGTTGITLLDWMHNGILEKIVVRYANRQFSIEENRPTVISDYVVTGPTDVTTYNVWEWPNYVNEAGSYAWYGHVYDVLNEYEYRETSFVNSTNTIIAVDYLDVEYIVTQSYIANSLTLNTRRTTNSGSWFIYSDFSYFPGRDWWETNSSSTSITTNNSTFNAEITQFLNGIIIGKILEEHSENISTTQIQISSSGTGEGRYFDNPPPTVTRTESQSNSNSESRIENTAHYVDLRYSVYIFGNILSVDGQTITLPFTNLYTIQNIDGPGYYPNDVPGTIKVLTSTPVKYSISSNQDITNHLNTITKPFLVSVL